jgi:Tol biopolymer transport system component
MKKIYFILLCLVLIISGCIQPSEEMIGPTNAQTELADLYALETERAKATSTPIPTLTPTPTQIGRSSGKILYEMSSIDDEDMSDIMVIDIETKETKNLTNNLNKKVTYYYPSVSPDGKKVAYSLVSKQLLQLGDYWKYELFIMDINGKNQEKITSIPMFIGNNQIDTLIQEIQPSWSPDGKKIAFSSNRDALINKLNYDDLEIFLIDLDSYEITQLTKAKDYSLTPDWSPDGNQIVFMSNRDGDWDIYIMNSDGSGKDINITNNKTSERFPSWSNDGEKIVYHSDRDGNNNLYLYDLDTKTETQLTNNPAGDWTGRWSPDDNWITYCSDRDGDYEIFIMNLITKEEIKITENQVVDGLQNWIP